MIDTDRLNEIQHDLEGTCTSLTVTIEEFDLDVSEDELEDRLLDGYHPIECCQGCGWWWEVASMEFDEEAQKALCPECYVDNEEAS